MHTFTQACLGWMLVSGLFAIAIIEIGMCGDRFITNQLNTHIPYMPGYVLAICTALLIMNDIQYTTIQKLLIILDLGIFIIFFNLSIVTHSALICAIFTIMVLGIFAILMASFKQRYLFQYMLFFVGLRFLLLYFQMLGGFLLAGIGLIISGMFIIGMVVLWHKHKSNLLVSIERWV
jgi:hypothetical protein